MKVIFVPTLLISQSLPADNDVALRAVCLGRLPPHRVYDLARVIALRRPREPLSFRISVKSLFVRGSFHVGETSAVKDRRVIP